MKLKHLLQHYSFSNHNAHRQIFLVLLDGAYCTEIFLHKGFKELAFAFFHVIPNGYPPGSTEKILKLKSAQCFALSKA
jgi:hypothetical protein